MSSAQSLREFISERLTAAAEEIFTEFEKTIVQYEEEIDRQRRLLEISWKPHINPHTAELPQHDVWKEKELLTDQQLCNQQERSSSLDQKEPEPPQIKEEDVCSGQDEEQLLLKQEADRFMVTPTYEEMTHHEPESQQEEVEPSQMKEDLKLLHIKEANEEQRPSWEDSTSSEIEEEQETDNFMRTSDNRRNQCESEANSNHLLSQNSAEAESQVQEGSWTVDPGSCRDEELRLNKRRPQARCPSNNVDCPKVKGEQKKPFLCTTCGKRFRLKYGFTAHVRTHTGERPFSCQTCGKEFIRNSALNSHMKTHTGEKPFSCQTCGKSFYKRFLLTNHMKIHTGEKPFSCQACGKKCIRKTDLMSHMRIHTGEKPFSCQICGNKFSQRSSLIRHTRTHTDEKCYVMS